MCSIVFCCIVSRCAAHVQCGHGVKVGHFRRKTADLATLPRKVSAWVDVSCHCLLFNDTQLALTGEYPSVAMWIVLLLYCCSFKLFPQRKKHGNPGISNLSTYTVDTNACIWFISDLFKWISESMCFFFLLTYSWVISDLCNIRGKNPNWVTWTIDVPFTQMLEGSRLKISTQDFFKICKHKYKSIRRQHINRI